MRAMQENANMMENTWIIRPMKYKVYQVIQFNGDIFIKIYAKRYFYISSGVYQIKFFNLIGTNLDDKQTSYKKRPRTNRPNSSRGINDGQTG